jgi:hypothetical protein
MERQHILNTVGEAIKDQDLNITISEFAWVWEDTIWSDDSVGIFPQDHSAHPIKEFATGFRISLYHIHDTSMISHIDFGSRGLKKQDLKEVLLKLLKRF